MAWKFGNIAKANERIVELEKQTEESAAALKLASENSDATTAHLATLNATIASLTSDNAKALAEIEALKAEKTELGSRVNKLELDAKADKEKVATIDPLASRKAAKIVAAQGVPAVKAGKNSETPATLTREEWSKLSPSSQANHFRSGGRLVD